MTERRPGGAVLTMRGDLPVARNLLEEFFAARGWRGRVHGPDRVDYEIGSRRRTVLLGGLAGRGFHLTAPIELREIGGVVEIRYRWGESAGRALGGIAGRSRAARVHAETAAALEQRLETDGRLLRARRL
ncbi:hypothetical protein ACT3SP_10370 [Brachybacterium sp. AOP43-C2-M15]|uniref:hypothetical protein n=1 Tax=Brachybacterium sp. AOP43-C2-M15 TaxID=3457661 RepID=UPI0040332479